MQHSGARKRERSAEAEGLEYANAGGERRKGGEMIAKEMKRLRLAQEHDQKNNLRRIWQDADVDMDAGEQLQADDARIPGPQCVDYKPINSTLRQCHYLRQLRKFQAERVSYLERRAPADVAAAALVHAMQPRRR